MELESEIERVLANIDNKIMRKQEYLSEAKYVRNLATEYRILTGSYYFRQVRKNEFGPN